MPLKNYQYDTIMREYNRRQAKNRRDLESRQREAYGRIPRLLEIDGEVAELSAAKTRALLTGQDTDPSLKDLKADIARLSAERTALLKENGYPKDYLELSFSCPLCQDTGYIGNKKCTCFKRAEIQLLYAQSNLMEILEKENFDHFSFDFYSATIDKAAGVSALELAKRAYKSAWDFVRDFDAKAPNLFLYGSTGVGKTFLTHCIAHELLKSAHCVLYFSAFDLFEEFARSAFSSPRENTEGDAIIFDCDLLIIDDLGTELTNSFVSSQLFLCINERILRKKSTIISTNLKLGDISALYSERTFSRITSCYQMVKLIGNDIRIEKTF